MERVSTRVKFESCVLVLLHSAGGRTFLRLFSSQLRRSLLRRCECRLRLLGGLACCPLILDFLGLGGGSDLGQLHWLVLGRMHCTSRTSRTRRPTAHWTTRRRQRAAEGRRIRHRRRCVVCGRRREVSGLLAAKVANGGARLGSWNGVCLLVRFVTDSSRPCTGWRGSTRRTLNMGRAWRLSCSCGCGSLVDVERCVCSWVGRASERRTDGGWKKRLRGNAAVSGSSESLHLHEFFQCLRRSRAPTSAVAEPRSAEKAKEPRAAPRLPALSRATGRQETQKHIALD